MMFLAPWYLAALAGAAVPVIIHLLSKRAIRTRPFSSLVFIEAVAHSALRWTRITQRRLLALRVSLLALTALALARPVCAPRPPVATVIALDASASMGASGGRVWGQARDTAVELARPAPMPVYVGLATQTLRIMQLSTWSEREKVIREFVPEGTALDMRRVFADATGYARGLGGKIRLVLVSDFQPDAWEDDLRVPPELELWGARVPGMTGNLALGPLTLAGTVRGDGMMEIGGGIQRYGHTDDSCTVTLMTARGRIETVVSLAGDDTPFSFRIPRPPEALVHATVFIDDRHGLVLDDRREAARWSRQRCRVAVMGSEGETRTRVKAALDPAGDGRWGFETDPGGLGDSADVVILMGATDPGPDADRALDHWMNGAGLVLVADNDFLSDEGRRLYERTMGAAPLSIRETYSGSAVIHYDHPVLAPFRRLPPHGFSPPQVRRFWRWHGEGTALISLEDGPLMVEPEGIPHGRVLAFMTGSVPPWSDWGSKASFVPLLQLAVEYAAGGLAVHPVPFSQDFSWRLHEAGEVYVLHSPDGLVSPVTTELTHEGIARARLGPFVDPGLYTLWGAHRPVALFEPVVSAQEQVVGEPATPPAVARWVEHPGFRWPSTRREPASLLFMFALGLLLGEAWLALRITRGAPPAASGGTGA
ncbi:BatA domain-containing protein [Candidatus Fermentibacteria bacterium]|nr:BatA domain-containing protein [Candidatus Fermentibacteria bacterium]